MALIDGIILIFLLIMISIGKFGMAAPDTMDEETKEQRGADEGAGGYADIPQLEGEGVDQADAEAMNSQRNESLAVDNARKGSKVDDLLNSFKFNGGLVPGGDDEDAYNSIDGDDNYKVRKGSAAAIDPRINQSKQRSISYAYSPVDTPQDDGDKVIKPIAEKENEDDTSPGQSLAYELGRQKRKKRSNSVDRLKIAEIM